VRLFLLSWEEKPVKLSEIGISFITDFYETPTFAK
jgi:hypothetical protein